MAHRRTLENTNSPYFQIRVRLIAFGTSFIKSGKPSSVALVTFGTIHSIARGAERRSAWFAAVVFRVVEGKPFCGVTRLEGARTSTNKIARLAGDTVVNGVTRLAAIDVAAHTSACTCDGEARLAICASSSAGWTGIAVDVSALLILESRFIFSVA